MNNFMLPEAVRFDLAEIASLAAARLPVGFWVHNGLASDKPAADVRTLAYEYAFRSFVDEVLGQPRFEHFLIFYEAFLTKVLEQDIFSAHFRLECVRELEEYFQRLEDTTLRNAAEKTFERRYQERLATRHERL